MLKLEPAVCRSEERRVGKATRKWFSVAGWTVKPAEMPGSLLGVVVGVIVEAAPDWLSVVALLVNTRAVNEAVVPPPEPIVRFEVRSTVPVKPVTVLLN